MNTRHYTPIDTLLANVDQAVRTVFGNPAVTERDNPSFAVEPCELNAASRQQAARLMRINHTGEVCAQALYQGQALTARLDTVRTNMERAAAEENDHLDWCKTRVTELGSHTSVLNPLFYAGAFCIGAIAGKLGDKWSLGFVAETEHQVVSHLDNHLERLPAADHKSRVILEKMREDEGHHATQALEAGGANLPVPVRWLMTATSKVMTGMTYWV